jgi:hypothetical protein
MTHGGEKMSRGVEVTTSPDCERTERTKEIEIERKYEK